MRETDNLQLILLNIGRSSHDGDWNWKGINSPFARLYYVIEGCARVDLPQGVQTLRPGSLYLIPPFTQHSYACDGLFSHFYIHIYETPSSPRHLLEECHFPVEIPANPLDFSLINRLLEINPDRELLQYDPGLYDNQPTLLRNIATEAQQAEYAALETRGILAQLLSRFLRYATPKAEVNDKRIANVLRHIRKHIDQPLRISQLAAICHLSDDHFIRLFKKEMDCTPIAYINQKKIERAQLMLLVENVPVKDIAYRLSFDNISYFNRVFKQITRFTPTQYCERLYGQ
ncbi:AraC-like DNA-binding protein [Parabacteroides sp. PFB2-10]|uniref:AraC family transcriptional regulator n=1 Tax=Parabacteroides sp. PFB2-10 TaxID=1742405 RepID=UPI0024760DE7|nr:AraC family transcriptional regulator [Parabacteroides sp. PFB2-10]MDH6313271.1 AraC-like DNA-binding protein [Parabacteroides sp. PFB2-10]